jgi:hypothetical protein
MRVPTKAEWYGRFTVKQRNAHPEINRIHRVLPTAALAAPRWVVLVPYVRQQVAVFRARNVAGATLNGHFTAMDNCMNNFRALTMLTLQGIMTGPNPEHLITQYRTIISANAVYLAGSITNLQFNHLTGSLDACFVGGAAPACINSGTTTRDAGSVLLVRSIRTEAQLAIAGAVVLPPAGYYTTFRMVCGM